MDLFMQTCTICANILFGFIIWHVRRESLRHINFNETELKNLIDNRLEILNEINKALEIGCIDFGWGLDGDQKYINRENIKRELQILQDRLYDLDNPPKPSFRIIRFIGACSIFTGVFLLLYWLTYG